jgi:uncharacterized protein (TIRG00374 family)
MEATLNFTRYWRVGLLGIAVSAVAIYFVISQVSPEQLGEALRTARYVYLLPTALFLLTGLVTRAVRWRVLLSDGLPLWRAFSIMNVAYLVNGLLPLRIGEVARAYLATRADPPVPVMMSFSTIIVERLLDLLAVVVLLAFALAAGPVPDQLRAAGMVFGPAALLGFLALVLLARYRPVTLRFAERLVDRMKIRQRLLARVNLVALLAHFLDGLKPLTDTKGLMRALGWTALSWGLSAIAGYILMFAFFERGDWAVTCLYIAAAAFAIAVPAMPGNIGTYEASILLALGAMGYDTASSTAVIFAVTVHGINLLAHAATGVIGFIQEGITLEQLSQGVQELRQPSPPAPLPQGEGRETRI